MSSNEKLMLQMYGYSHKVVEDSDKPMSIWVTLPDYDLSRVNNIEKEVQCWIGGGYSAFTSVSLYRRDLEKFKEVLVKYGGEYIGNDEDAEKYEKKWITSHVPSEVKEGVCENGEPCIYL